MGAELYQTIRSAVTSIRPDLAGEFNECRTREAIVGFMNRNFPLTKDMIQGSINWNDYMSVKIPEMLKEYFNE